jgi:outer membrane protein TolC
MRAMLKEGFIENTDVDQIYLTSLNLENAIQTLTRQVDASKNLLKFQLGLSTDKSIELTDDLESLVNSVTLESILGQPFDISKNINYRIFETQVKLGELNLKREKSNYLPTIAGFYQHSEKARKADFDFTMKDIAGVSFNLPIFTSWQRKTMVDERKLELDKILNSKNQVAEGLKLEYINAENECKTAFERYLNEKKNIELANKIYSKTLLKYKEGVSSSMDVTTAQNQFLSAQTNLFNASFALLTAKNKLDKLNNKL